MYATYFGGDPKDPSVPVDEEARDLWLQFLPEERVIPCGAKVLSWLGKGDSRGRRDLVERVKKCPTSTPPAPVLRLI